MKICSRCKVEQPIINFNKKRTTKDGLAYHCKSCEKISHANHYVKNKQPFISRAKKQLERNMLEYKKWREGLFCTICGESDWNCIDLHHLNPDDKKFTIGGSTGYGIDTPKFKQELSKCIAVCANCHRKIHVYGLEETKHRISSKEVMRQSAKLL